MLCSTSVVVHDQYNPNSPLVPQCQAILPLDKNLLVIGIIGEWFTSWTQSSKPILPNKPHGFPHSLLTSMKIFVRLCTFSVHASKWASWPLMLAAHYFHTEDLACNLRWLNCPEGSASLPATLHVSHGSLCCGQHRFPYHSKSPTHGVPSSPLALLWTLLGLDIASTAPFPLHVSCSSLYCGQLKFLYCSKDSTQGVPSPPLTFPWTLQHCKYCSVPPTQYFLWWDLHIFVYSITNIQSAMPPCKGWGHSKTSIPSPLSPVPPDEGGGNTISTQMGSGHYSDLQNCCNI